MKQSIDSLKSFFESGDAPTQQNFSDLIDSFVHKDLGVTISKVSKNGDGDVFFSFSDGNTLRIDQYKLPASIPISFIQGLQNALVDINTSLTDSFVLFNRQLADVFMKVDGVIVKSIETNAQGDVTFTFSDDSFTVIEKYQLPAVMPISFIEGLQVQLDLLQTNIDTAKTIAAQELADLSVLAYKKADGFIVKSVATAANGDITFTFSDDSSTTIEKYIPPVAQPISFITDLQNALDAINASIVALQNNKRDKTSHAKSIVDSAGNLELKGDVESPSPRSFYGTDSKGIKGYHKLPANYFHRANTFLGGSTENIEDQEFEIDLSAFKELKVGDKVELHGFEFRGDFSSFLEYLTISLDTPTNAPFRIGDFSAIDSDSWIDARGKGDGVTATLVMLPTGNLGFKIYVSPSVFVSFSPGNMTNWWELRARSIQFNLQ